ncbi:MAG TPA: YdeI/OmpD-associated family protein [Flavisolibacter sp.]|nr:YdeI/OmpD-associated family protein [Flavisolibacter sp.]
MVQFNATIKKFDSQGEKTGWTYIEIPAAIAQKLNPNNKKGFRVKGRLDEHEFSMIALLPMGSGDFIMALNAGMRKGIKKQKGAVLKVKMEVDSNEIQPPEELMECLQDEPEAFEYFNSLPKGHQNYFTNWINSAKTDSTKAKRIAATLDALNKKWDFGQMIRAMKKMSNQ